MSVLRDLHTIFSNGKKVLVLAFLSNTKTLTNIVIYLGLNNHKIVLFWLNISKQSVSFL